MKVRALETGFFGGARRRQWAVFDVEDGTPLPKWLEAADTPPEKSKAKPQAKAKKQPDTLKAIADATSPTDPDQKPWVK